MTDQVLPDIQTGGETPPSQRRSTEGEVALELSPPRDQHQRVQRELAPDDDRHEPRQDAVLALPAVEGVLEPARDVGDVIRRLPPDAPEVLDFYADRSPIFMAAAFDADAAAARGQAVGDGTPVHLTIPTDNPWVPLRILALGRKDAEIVQADVYLLTDRRPETLPQAERSRGFDENQRGLIQEVSEPASTTLRPSLGAPETPGIGGARPSRRGERRAGGQAAARARRARGRPGRASARSRGQGSNPLIVGDRIYVQGGINGPAAACLDKKSGTDLSWLNADGAYPVTKMPVPRTADTVVNYTNGSIVAGGRPWRSAKCDGYTCQPVDPLSAAPA